VPSVWSQSSRIKQGQLDKKETPGELSMKKEKISKVRLEVELEVPTRQLKELSKEFERETVEQFLQLWVPERRSTRLVVEMISEEREENPKEEEVA